MDKYSHIITTEKRLEGEKNGRMKPHRSHGAQIKPDKATVNNNTSTHTAYSTYRHGSETGPECNAGSRMGVLSLNGGE